MFINHQNNNIGNLQKITSEKNRRITVTDPAELQFKSLVFNFIMNRVNSENKALKSPDPIDLYH
jgi:hypothetical protein